MDTKKLLVVACLVAGISMPAIASAQNAEPGELIELRSDDPRCDEGFRCFQFGAYEPGNGYSFRTVLARVNADLPEGETVTIEQLDAANQCRVLYRRTVGETVRFRVNGSCPDYNRTTDRVTYAEFCEGATTCARWSFENEIYRVPAAPRLTPDERAEEMAREIENAVVTETVPAPATLGANLRELIELQRSPQSPSDEHVAAALTALANALDRTSAAAPEPDMAFELDPEPSAELLETQASLTVAEARIDTLENELIAARAAANAPNPFAFGVAILAIMLLGAIAFIIVRPAKVVDLTESERNLATLNARKAVEPEIRSLERALEAAKTMAEVAMRRFENLESAWSGMKPAFALAGDAPDGGLATYVNQRVRVATQEISEQRDRFERQFMAMTRENADERKRAFDLVDEKLGMRIDALRTGDFGLLLSNAGSRGQRAVDPELVRGKFGFRAKQQVTPLFIFLDSLYENLGYIRKDLDLLTGRVATEKPEPNRSLAAPRVPLVLVPEDDDEGTTLDPIEDALPPPSDEEVTVVVANPYIKGTTQPPVAELKPESTQPFARDPSEAAKLEEARNANGGNGSHIADVMRKLLEGQHGEDRPHRHTMRGVGTDSEPEGSDDEVV